MRVQSGSVTDGPGVELPDPPQGGGGGAPDMSAYAQPDYGGQQRAYLAAIMAQQQQMQQAQAAQQPQQGNPYGDWSQYFQPQSAPSGSPTDVGWMNALQPWQGGVSVGGQPGTPPSGGTPWTGGGSMAQANPNYWMMGAGAGMTPKMPGYDDSWLYQGGGLSGDAGYGGGGGGFGGGGGGGGGQGPGGGGGRGGGPTGGMSMADAFAATVNATPAGWGNFGNMTGPMGPPSGQVGPVGNALGWGPMGAPPGFGNENGFDTAPGDIGGGGGFY